MDRYSDRGYGRDDARNEDARDDDRGFIHRASDEVRSWFGDEEADRRRRMDERYGRPANDDDDQHVHPSRYGRGGNRAGEQAYGRPDAGYVPRDDRGRTPRHEARGPGERGYYDDQHFSPSGFGRRDFDEREAGRRPERGGEGRWESRGDYGRSGEDFGRRTASGSSDYRMAPSRGGSDNRMAPGPYSGHGPEEFTKNYDRIKSQVNERLTHDGHLDATRVRVTVEDGEVTLEGTVADRRMKRLAEDIAESVSGVTDVHNRLRIESLGGSATSGAMEGGFAGSGVMGSPSPGAGTSAMSGGAGSPSGSAGGGSGNADASASGAAGGSEASSGGADASGVRGAKP